MANYKAIQKAVKQANKEMGFWTKALDLHEKHPGMAGIVKKAKQAPQTSKAAQKKEEAA